MDGQQGRPDQRRHEVVVTVNNHDVVLESHKVKGIEIKRAAMAQGVEIQEDFLLTLEAHGGGEARLVADDEVINVTKNSVFTANGGDDYS